MQSDTKEVIALRNFMFNQKVDESYIPDCTRIDQLDTIRGLIIGGHINWQNKIKEYLPTWKIIKAGVNNLDSDIIQRCDVVIFNAGHLNHSLYYKVIDLVRNSNIQIGYITSTNIINTLREIADICERVSLRNKD